MLVRLKEPLDHYSQMRARQHGWLYIVEEHPVTGIVIHHQHVPKRRRDLYEARSIATGVVVTFRPECIEVIPDGEKL